ncbi:MAG: hypothetical protein ACLQJ0_08005 [Steroidobacteraceae bacterium]
MSTDRRGLRSLARTHGGTDSLRWPRAAAPTQTSTVVLEALGQVADDMWALQYDAQILTVDRHAMDVALEALKLQQQSYSVGTTTVLNLLTALGGEWWNDEIEAAAQ